MFETLRRMILPIIIIVLFFFVSMIVLEWGLGFSRRQRYVDANVAAVINGEDVSWQDFNNIYNSMYQTEAAQTEEELPENKIREIQQSAWQQLLHDRLLRQQAREYGVTVTGEEVYNFLRYNPPPELQQLPYFQTEGQFDYQKYFNAMADPQAAAFWASVEPFARESVMKQKVQEMVVLTAHVTESEVREFYVADKEKLSVGVVNVGYKRFSNPPPRYTDDDLRAFFEERREDYPIDERAALNIAILEKDPEPLDWERSHNRAMAIYDSVAAGAELAEMARRYSEDPGSAENGGDLDWFPRGQMVEEFDKRVFNMQEGQISEPVRTQFGWHIIKLHGIKEEMDRPPGKTEMELVKKAHASHILIKVEPGQETLDRAYRRLEEFHAAAKKEGFFKAAQDLQIPIRRPEPFFRGGNIQFIGRDARAGVFAFENDVDEISELFENNSAFFVVQVAAKFPAGLATYEETQQKVELDWVQYMVSKTCRDTAEAIYGEIQKGVDLERAAKMHGEEYEVLEDFTRNSFVQELGRDPSAQGMAFSLTESGQVSRPVDHRQGCAIFQLIERPGLDLSDYNVARDSVYQFVLNSKRQELYARWFDNLVKNSDIVNNIEKALLEGEEL